MTSFLDYLKESEDCLYIYNRNYSIYGSDNKERYTVVVKDSWVCPEDWIGFDTGVYQLFRLSQWFNCITSGNLIGWECACLNKKYIIKEHVKLLMTTNPLQLRKDVDKDFDSKPFDELIRQIKFSIQIIENHKIVNYKDGLDDINLINKLILDGETDEDELNKIIDKSYSVLKSLTDGMLKQEIRKRADASKL